MIARPPVSQHFSLQSVSFSVFHFFHTTDNIDEGLTPQVPAAVGDMVIPLAWFTICVTVLVTSLVTVFVTVMVTVLVTVLVVGGYV